MTDPGPSDGTTTAPGEGESTSVATEDGPAGLQAALREMEDRWRRALADLDNLRKRVQRDRVRMQEEERSRAAREWLPVLDNLDLALAHAKPVPDPVMDGVRAVRDQALDVLARLGFPRREDRGSSFDPQRHAAVSTVPLATAPEGTADGTVLEVVRPGYGTDERLLRPASVVVATKAD